MKKSLFVFAFLISIILILTSCADTDLTVTITENGGTIAYEYYVDKQIIDEYFNSDIPSGLATCEIDEIDGRICYVYKEATTAQNFTELENKLCNIKLYGETGMNFFNYALASSTKLTLKTNPFVTEDIKNIALIQGVDLNELIRLSVRITMPYEIEKYSEGTLSEDKKTLMLELSNFDVEQNIEIKCITEKITYQKIEDHSKTPLIISGVLLTLVGIGATSTLSVFLITRRNRKRAEAMPETPIDKI